MTRVAIGGILHESNTFNPALTRLGDFVVSRGDQVVSTWRGSYHEIGGFIEGASRHGFEIVPTLMAEATPAGRVTSEAFEALTHELAERLIGALPLDGVLLALHGAMVSEQYPDGDGEIMSRLRETLGRDLPIVVTHDFHANISEQVVEKSTVLLVYKTNPHLDQLECGLQAVEILSRVLQGSVKPVQALCKPPMLLNIVHQNTGVDPMKGIMQTARALEQNPRILAASVAAGYQYADVFEMGPSAVVVADADAGLAEREAKGLSDKLWNIRDELAFELPGAAEAVRRAKESNEAPVVLADMGDNIGGGSAGDSTFLLSELLHQQAEGWLVVLADPQAAQSCAHSGVGTFVTIEVGGKTDTWHGVPIPVTGRVKSIHDGRYQETEPRHGGYRDHDQGLTAVLEIGESACGVPRLLVLTTQREAPFSLQQLLSLGIEPQRQKILVVKAAIAYRAAYEPIAGRIIEVDSPGLTAVNPTRFTYRDVRRPLWGLD